jgi:hypothetical protein
MSLLQTNTIKLIGEILDKETSELRLIFFSISSPLNQL